MQHFAYYTSMAIKLACIFNTKIKFYTSLIVSYNKKICPCNYEDKMRQHKLNPSDFASSAINSQFSIKILKTASEESVVLIHFSINSAVVPSWNVSLW